MRVAVTGSSGMVGQALIAALKKDGHEALCLLRKHSGAGIFWDPKAGLIDAEKLEGLDGVVHLAGRSIVGRWTPSVKKEILESRVQGTRLLAETCAKLKRPPKVFVSASAIGFFGDRGDQTLDESSDAGTGYLSDVCRAWESAALPAKESGIRTVWLRIGIVLSKKGGALAKMLPPFQLGAGGILGPGTQYMSWIALEDLVQIILFALKNEKLQGAVNAVSPKPVTNREFTRALGQALHRPAIFPVPAFGMRLLFGEMADALLLASTRVLPKKLQESGYSFKYSALESALPPILSAD